MSVVWKYSSIFVPQTSIPYITIEIFQATKIFLWCDLGLTLIQQQLRANNFSMDNKFDFTSLLFQFSFRHHFPCLFFSAETSIKKEGEKTFSEFSIVASSSQVTNFTSLDLSLSWLGLSFYRHHFTGKSVKLFSQFYW